MRETAYGMGVFFLRKIISMTCEDKLMAEQILELSWLKPDGRPASLPDASTTNPAVEAAWRQKMIREAAYFRSQHRRPCYGTELEDWLAAEKEVDESQRYPSG